MAHCDTYRESLAITYPLLGHALWEPTSVDIGDVGYIRNGKFLRLFNAVHPESHPSNLRFGVPESHEPLLPRVPDHIDVGTLKYSHYCSVGINVTSEHAYPSVGPEDFPRVSFSNRIKRGGAVLYLPVDARRQDTLARRDFGQWMIKHIDCWFAFAQRLGLGIEHMEEIVLVTGCHHTRSWANIAFLEGQRDAQASFGFEVIHGPTTKIKWQFSPWHARGAICSWGPEGEDLPENQCIFVRGFRVRRLFRILPRHLRGAASPNPKTNQENDDDELHMELIPRPAVTTYHDPLHVLLEHVAKKATDCDLALVHDDDLARIDGIYDDEGALQPDAVTSHLRIFEAEVPHHVPDESIQETGTEETRVVMFSKELQEWTSTVVAPQTEFTLRPSESSVISSSSWTPPVGSPTKRTQDLYGSTGSHTRTLSDNHNLSSGLGLLISDFLDSNLQNDTLEMGRLTPSEGPSQYSTTASTDLTVYDNHSMSDTKSPNHVRMAASTIPVSSQPEIIGMGSRSVLVDGYISRSFGPRQAEQYLTCLLKTHGVSSHPATYFQGRESPFFFAASVPQHISLRYPGRSSWVLDRGFVAKGTVVTQTLWAPHTITDRKQHVTDAELQMPIYFEGLDGTLGLSLEAAASGRCHGLVDAQAFAPLGLRVTTHFRIGWPGYLEYKRQIQVRDETALYNPITISRFAHHAGRSVEAFLRNCKLDPGSQDPRRGDWRIGVGGIVREDIVIIGAIHVSAGSWMPILQLNRDIR